MHAQSCLTLGDPVDCSPTRLLCPWDSPGKNIGVGCHFLLQWIFPTQGLNPGLLPWQAGFLPQRPLGSIFEASGTHEHHLENTRAREPGKDREFGQGRGGKKNNNTRGWQKTNHTQYFFFGFFISDGTTGSRVTCSITP